MYVGALNWIWLFKYGFSIGFKSGDWHGFYRIFRLFSGSHIFVDLAVCWGSLYCWKIQSGESTRFSNKIIRIASKIFSYAATFILRSIIYMLSVPYAGKKTCPDNKAAASKVFVGSELFGLKATPSVLNTWFLELRPNNSVLVSSAHNTLPKYFFFLSLCSRSNFHLTSLCISNSSKVFTWISLLIVSFET